ncbi:MAG: GspH/FimT family pseudopilin [Alphaproteobacteria bacterium]|nr:GspH/FimT family pseudopilin [Alphaproteobacteria bacterium]
MIEIVVTLAILAFALVLVAGYKGPWSRGLGLRGVAAELASGLRQARSQAIASNRPVAVGVDANRHSYRVGTGAIHALPTDVSIELVTIAGERRGARVGDIQFNPDGSSTGGRIALADTQRRLAIGVDWLTGRVSVANVR